MPHKVGSKWKWGNVERSSKDDLRKTVYGIWKKNGGKGSFSKFWKTGRVSESETALADFVTRKVPAKEIESLLDEIETYTENPRFSRKQFEKFLPVEDEKRKMYYGLFDGDKCLALSFLVRVPEDCVYVNEIQSFSRGCGRILLEDIIERSSAMWLAANPHGGQKLVDYYRGFDTLEEVNKNGDHLFICAKDPELRKRIIEYIRT